MSIFRLIRDSRGEPSWTHTMAVPAIIGITGWFLVGGMEFNVTVAGNPYRVLTATKTAGEYVAAVGVWLAFFAQREYVNKVSERKVGNGTGSAPWAAT